MEQEARPVSFGLPHRAPSWDLGILIPIVVLSAMGLVVLYSASLGHGALFFVRQLIWCAVATVGFVVAAWMDLDWIRGKSQGMYVLCILLLVLTIFWPTEGRSAARWISIGPVSFQASEFTKPVLVAVLARLFSTKRSRQLTMRDFFAVLVLILLPAGLVMKQPDLGTAVVVVLCGFAPFLFLSLPRRWWISLLTLGVVGVIWIWFNMLDYQMNRIRAFLNPEAYRFREAWHTTQSTMAVGSGGWFGKGYLKGTQNQWDFISENHNDFIFSTIAEEFGFLGSVVVLSLFCGIVLRALYLAHQERRPFAAILKASLAMLLFIQVFINVGMVIGMIPVVGLSLPFFSYGGSSLVTFAMVAGVLANRRGASLLTPGLETRSRDRPLFSRAA